MASTSHNAHSPRNSAAEPKKARTVESTEYAVSIDTAEDFAPSTSTEPGAGPEDAGTRERLRDPRTGALLIRWKSVRIVAAPAKDLLKDDDVRRWYENMNRSSVITSISMLRRINLFCHKNNVSPKEFAEIAKKDTKKAEDMLMDYIDWMEDCQYTPGYMECMAKAVKSWLNYHRVDSRIKIRFNKARASRTLANEPNPEPIHIKQMLSMANPRGRAVISMMAFSGIRPQVMGNANGSDGLLLGDFPELVLDGNRPHFSTTPAMVVVRSTLSKAGSKYVTFLSGVGCEAVLGYLRERAASGEILVPESPLIRSHPGWEGRRRIMQRNSPFVRTCTITGAVVDIVKAILPMRVYALRGYFDTQLLLAESNGYMTHAYRQFFMGHKGDIEARDTTNKGRLTGQMLDDMRRSYENSQYFLHPSNDENPDDRKDNLLNQWKKQAKIQGVDISDMLKEDFVAGGSPRVPGAGAPAPAAIQGAVRPGEAAPEAKPADAPDAKPEEAPTETKPADVPPEKAADAPPDPPPADVRPGRPSGVPAAKPTDAPPAKPADASGSALRIAKDDDELIAYMNEGWDIHKELANGKYVVRHTA